MVDFHGEFECEPAPSGVSVTHRYTFDFKGPGRLIEPFIRRWLRKDIRREVGRLRAILEGQPRHS